MIIKTMIKSIFLLSYVLASTCAYHFAGRRQSVTKWRSNLGAFTDPSSRTDHKGLDRSRPVTKSNFLKNLAPRASVAVQQSLDAKKTTDTSVKNSGKRVLATDASVDKEKPSYLWTALAQQFKDMARQWFIDRAENAGVPWTQLVQKYDSESVHSRLMELAAETEDVGIEYPAYYTQAFHGYDEGNLNWQAAMEGEAASLSMCVNYWRSDGQRGPQVTESWVRGNTTAKLSAYLDERGFGIPRSMLDVGASVGVSTQFLHEAFPGSEVTGLDLSPYFVAMATYRARENDLPIRYIHANAEHTGLPSGSVDVITVNYMLHEVPTEATKRILSELHRLLRPGGVILICDLDGDKVRDNFVVSSFRKWAFEVTEPHIYQYYQNDLLEDLAGVGFDPSSLKKTSNDPINALWLAQKAVEKGSASARPGMRVEGRVLEGRE